MWLPTIRQEFKSLISHRGDSMLRFILREPDEEPINDFKTWKIIMLGEPNKLIAEFIGNDKNDIYLNTDIAPLVAGDYVEFLNEKYLDKGLNEEWPPKDKKLYFKYHLQKALEYDKYLGIDKKEFLKKMDKYQYNYARPSSEEVFDWIFEEIMESGYGV